MSLPNRKKIISMILMISFGLLAGCASIVHGTKQEETFVSKPSGAEIYIDNIAYGKTPKTIALKRSSEHTVTIKLPGYEPESFKLTHGVSGWVFGNIIFGGLIGIVIDAADGAIYYLEPGQLSALQAKQIQPDKENTITILLLKNVSGKADLQKIGQLERKK